MRNATENSDMIASGIHTGFLPKSILVDKTYGSGMN